MIKLFGGLKSYVQLQDITTASGLFRLHCSFTAAVLIAFSLVITATQYVGKPIMCIDDGKNKDALKAITTFCWISSTFTMADAHGRPVGSAVAHPGVTSDFGEDKKYYSYYWWVCIALFFQGVMCYFPKYLWDTWEGGLLKSVNMGLKMSLFSKEDRDEKKSMVVKYLMEHVKRHSMYAFRYWFCELLCLLNVVLQLYLMNRFFDGEFLTYGIRVMGLSLLDQDEREDPMVYIFPRVTKCTFHKYGPSGTIQKHDSLCILPLNIVNEKTYIFIWFWFMLLFSMLSFLVLYRALIVCCSCVRPHLLRLHNKLVPHEAAQAVVRKTNVGDWWVLYMLARNMDPLVYREVVTELAKKIERDVD